MAKETIEGLLVIAEQCFTEDIDICISICNSKDDRIVMKLSEARDGTVAIEYTRGHEIRTTKEDLDSGWQRELCQDWGIDPNDRNWYVQKSTFSELESKILWLEHVQENLEPYHKKGEL